MTDVIRRKIDRARPVPSEGAPGADRGWRLALARAARDAMALDVEFRSLSVSRLTLIELLELVPDRALIGLLDGPHGALGVIMLDALTTATFIEQQTLGRLSSQPPPARKASRIDAAMVAGVIDRALLGLDEALAEEADLIWAGGFRYSSYLEDSRPLALMLEEDAYRVLSANVAYGPERREGRVILVLPAQGRGDSPAMPTDDADVESPQFSAALAAQVMQVDCRIDAVVGRLRLPLRQVMSLHVGELLILPSASLEEISLETIEGRKIAEARLGQQRGLRAVKLAEAISVGATTPIQILSHMPPGEDEGLPPEFRAAG